MKILIKKNSNFSSQEQEIFTTREDNQEFVNVRLFEGENENTKDNNLLGEFNVVLEKAKRGVPKIEVTISVDENGIIQLKAIERNMDIE